MSAVDAYNVFRQNCPSRQVFDLVGERWTGLVLLALRELERDGLVSRQAFATVPVTVEYSLTPLGESLCEVIETLRTWAYANVGELTAAQRRYVRAG